LVTEPFFKTPKGTVRKGEMLEVYAREVNGVYGAAI
jgi:hypothetical protein